MAHVSWTLDALDDLEAIAIFISRDSPGYAKLFVDTIFRATDRLSAHPLSGRIVPEIGREEIREVIYGNYRIIYRVRADEVEVLTVFHGAKLIAFKQLDDV